MGSTTASCEPLLVLKYTCQTSLLGKRNHGATVNGWNLQSQICKSLLFCFYLRFTQRFVSVKFLYDICESCTALIALQTNCVAPESYFFTCTRHKFWKCHAYWRDSAQWRSNIPSLSPLFLLCPPVHFSKWKDIKSEIIKVFLVSPNNKKRW